ncbi:SSI family serine proteinase inhibitor [Streptomyces sp. NPDC088400]|uniref:SSI family serine proteinase inhibitor n=1 Tax=Streptomyces sp. NPDC088400 TaxID=3365861 RepID=UPI0038099693
MLRRLVCTAAASVAMSAVALGTVAPAASADAFASTSTVPLTQFTRPAQIAPLAPIAHRAPLPLPLPLPQEREGRGGREGGLKAQDAFSVTVAGLKTKAAPATYQLRCGPAGGSHPQARSACNRLVELAADGKDPFAPVAKGTLCTMQHGGDATARVAGTWKGRSVKAAFNQQNGCEIARWRTLEPFLPSATS